MILALLFLSRAFAAPDPGAAWLADSIGNDGVSLLRERGLVVIQGKPGEERLAYAAEDGLAELAAGADRLVLLEQAWSAFSSGKPSPQLPPPPSAALSPSALEAARLLAAIPDDLAELGKADRSAAEVLASTAPILFDTSWGRAFAARTHADLIDDPLPLVRTYFDEKLAGPRPDREATAHFLGALARWRGVDAASTLAEDAAAGRPSEKLRVWLARYFADQRRLFSLERSAAELRRLDKKEGLSAELARAARVGRAVLADPGWAARAKAESSREPGSSGPRLTISEAHVSWTAENPRPELGGKTTASGAYWVDGLREGASAPVELSTFRSDGRRARDLASETASASASRLYPFSRTAGQDDSRPFRWWAAVSAPGLAPRAVSAAVETSEDFERALGRLGEADALLSSCDFKGAEAAYARLRDATAEAANRKAQYNALAKTLEERRAAAARGAVDLARLEEQSAAAREDSSADRCRYDAARAESALALARKLSAGCGRFAVELEGQLSSIRRRLSDARAYRDAAAESRSQARACQPAKAASWAARALAILGADPAARCGAVDADAKALERELVDDQASALWTVSLDKQLAAAASDASPAVRLRGARRALARLDSLPDAACRGKDRAAAEKLAASAADVYAGPDIKAALEALPPDNDLPQAAAAVALERRRLLEEAASLERQKAEQQAPAELVKPAPTPEAPAPQPRPRIKAKDSR